MSYAQAYGAHGSRVQASEDFVPVLQSAFERGGVHVVVVPVDYSENTRVLVDQLQHRVPAPSEVPHSDIWLAEPAVIVPSGTKARLVR